MTFIQEKHHNEAIELLRDLIRIPSVLTDASEGAPFGEPIRKALDRVLEWCAEQGFDTYCDPDGYYGYAEICSGTELFAILCHLDVVPAGDHNEWKTDPFEAVLADGALYGRGTQDDKGPTVAALLAVKALMDAGVSFKKRIRFIFGTDEETLWRGMQRYAEIEPVADMGFAPDSSFPLTYAEKGLLQAKLHGSGTIELMLEAGDAFNVVPAQATYTGGATEQVVAQLQKHGYEHEASGDSVTVIGRSQHAKDAALGVNAVTRLATALSAVEEHSALSFIAQAIGEDATGKQLFGVIEDEPSGKLSINVAGVTITPERSEVRLDIRIPVLANKDELVETLATTAKQYGLEYEEYDYLAPLYVPLDSTLVSTLLEVYREHTGDQTPPQSSGGATYARTMANCVAYGAAFPHTVETEHKPNECIVLADMYEAMAIYAQAVYRLTT